MRARQHIRWEPPCGTVVCAGAGAAILIAAASPAFAAACAGPAGFGAWLQGFKKEAVAQGISPQVVSAALDGVSYDPAVIAKDRGQSVFAQTFLQFSDRMVSEQPSFRLDRSCEKECGDLRQDPAEIRRARSGLGRLLGIGDRFRQGDGQFGDAPLPCHLAFDCRRPDEFTEQLLDALRVIQRGDLSPVEMRGPWAGEVGQFHSCRVSIGNMRSTSMAAAGAI